MFHFQLGRDSASSFSRRTHFTILCYSRGTARLLAAEHLSSLSALFAAKRCIEPEHLIFAALSMCCSAHFILGARGEATLCLVSAGPNRHPRNRLVPAILSAGDSLTDLPFLSARSRRLPMVKG